MMANNLKTFTVEFKRDCLAFLLKDEKAARSVGLNLPKDFFEYDDEYHIIFITFRDFLEKYKARPSRHELVDVLKDECKAAGMDDADIKGVLTVLKELWAWNKYNPLYVKDKLYDAVTAHCIYQVAKQLPAYIDDGEYDELLQAMSKARAIGKEQDELTDYWKDGYDRVDRVRKTSVRHIPTGMEHIDKQIKGGLPRGNIAMVMGASGFGKSALLGQIALKGSLAGYTVAYLTLELSSDLFMLRCDSHTTGVPLDDVDRIPAKKMKRKMFNYYDGLDDPPGPMYVQYFPTKSISVYQVEDYIRRLRDEQGITVDLLVVDYFDLLKMAGTYDKKYEALEENVEMMRGLAGQYNMAIWTASQTNRGGLEKETVDMEDIASGYGKVFPLDLLLTISQSKAEKSEGVFRLYTAKSRIGPQGGTIWVEPDWKHMRFFDLSEAEAKSKGLYVSKKPAATRSGGSSKPSNKPLSPIGDQA